MDREAIIKLLIEGDGNTNMSEDDRHIQPEWMRELTDEEKKSLVERRERRMWGYTLDEKMRMLEEEKKKKQDK
jgi:hypothetical protein